MKIYDRIIQSDIYQRSLEADEKYTELSVKYYLKDNKVVDGVIDLLFREKNNWTLCDYKVLLLKEEEQKMIRDEYKNQLEIYMQGLKNAGIDIKGPVNLVFMWVKD